MPATNAKKPIIAWACTTGPTRPLPPRSSPPSSRCFLSPTGVLAATRHREHLPTGAGQLAQQPDRRAASPLFGGYCRPRWHPAQVPVCLRLLGVLATGCLYLVAEGAWELAIVVYVLAAVGFSGGNTFYDALLVEVAGRDKSDSVSALGYSLGYLGGGLLFALNVAMVLHPTTFGLADASAAVRVCFLLVAVWWAGFSLPLFLWVEESPPVARSSRLERGLGRLSAAHRN